MPINLHIYKSSLQYDSRIFKMTRSLVENGIENDIHIVGMGNGKFPEYERIDEHRLIWRVNIAKPPAIPKMQTYLLFRDWFAKIKRQYRDKEISVIQSNSIEDLPVGLNIKRSHPGSKLIYDCHELETEKNGFNPTQRLLAKYREAKLIHKADYVTVVGPSIATWYEDRYSLKNLDVIMNVPYRKDYDESSASPNRIFRDKFNIPDSSILYLYQGALIGLRNVELILRVFSKLSDKHHLVVMGHGYLESEVLKFVQQYPNIHFQPSAPPDQIKLYTSGADVGLILIDDSCLSYHFMLPNKLFEYMLSGLPVFTGIYPDVNAITDKYDNGWKTEINEDAIYKAIQSISVADILKRREGSLKARNDFGWELEEKKLIRIYNKLKGIE